MALHDDASKITNQANSDYSRGFDGRAGLFAFTVPLVNRADGGLVDVDPTQQEMRQKKAPPKAGLGHTDV